MRVTTSDISLDSLLTGQLRFLNRYYDVVGVAADSGRMDLVREREGVRCVDVPMHREISLSADLASLFALIRLMRRERPWCVHANTPKGSLLAMAAAMLTRVPHRIYYVTGLRYQGAHGVMRLLLMTMERLTCLMANKVIPEGEGVKRTLQRDHITHRSLSVIRYGNINGIDSARFSPEAVAESREKLRAQYGFGPDDIVFIFIGRICRDKGVDELAAAVRDITAGEKRCRLLLVGSFEDRQNPVSADSRAFLLSSPAVTYVGQQEDVRPFLKAADALVLPSYREGFPNVVLQGGAMGLPCIVTDINGCNEEIADHVNGLIVPAPLERPDMEQRLREAMLTLTRDKALRLRLASQARDMVTSRYEQKDVWEALLAMYRSL